MSKHSPHSSKHICLCKVFQKGKTLPMKISLKAMSFKFSYFIGLFSTTCQQRKVIAMSRLVNQYKKCIIQSGSTVSWLFCRFLSLSYECHESAYACVSNPLFESKTITCEQSLYENHIIAGNF